MILITGANGIVGRALCNTLLGEGQNYIPLVHNRKPGISELSRVIDLTVPGALDNFAESNITSIVHLAAAVPHSVSYPDTEKSAQLTRSMDFNVRTLQKRLEVPLIYMSSCALYEKSSAVVKHEDDLSVLKIDTPYLAAKIDGEGMFSEAAETVIMRLSAVVGPGIKKSSVLSRFIMTAREGMAIKLWGEGDREQDFLDVKDIARLVIRVLKRPVACTLNVASGKPVTMKELAELVVTTIGSGSVEHAGIPDPRDGETARYCISKSYELYGWKPKVDLESMCRALKDELFERNQ